MTDSSDDEKLADILTEFGPEGFGVWWLLVEAIGRQMDSTDRCEASYSLEHWARKLYISKRKTTSFLTVFSEKNLLFLEYDDSNSIGKILVKIPNMLKFRDEYSKKSGQTPVKHPDTVSTKKQIQKEKQTQNKKEKKQFTVDLLPCCASWHAFKAMRKTIKKPLSAYAEKLIVDKLHSFHAKGHDPTVILNNSVENSWQGVFEPKEKNNEYRSPGGVRQASGTAKKGMVDANIPESDWL